MTGVFPGARKSMQGLPMLPIQHALWLDELRRGRTATYNVPICYRIRGRVEQDLLSDALNAVAERHPYLRSRVSEVGGEPQIFPEPRTRLPLAFYDLRTIPEAIKEQRISDWIAQPLLLGAAPHLVAALFQVADDEQIIAIVVHHAFFDSWSADIFRNDLQQAYSNPVSLRQDKMVLEHERTRVDAALDRLTSKSDSLLAYWRSRLSGLPGTTTWPHDRPRPDRPTYRGGLIEFKIPATVMTRLRRLARRQHVTPFTVAATALHILMARVSDSSHDCDVAIGTPVALRSDPADHNVVAYLANTVVLRRSVDLGRSFEELIHDGRELLREDMRNAEYPFPWLVRHVATERSVSQPPLVQVLLVMEDEADAPLMLGDLSGEPCTFHTGTAKFDLTVTLAPSLDGYHGAVEYASDIYDEMTANVFADSFVRLLRQLAARPAAAVGDLVIAETEVLNDTETQPSAEPARRAHDQFASQAMRYPDIPAVRWDGGQLSYRQLDIASARLASEICSIMAPGTDAVAVYARRSPALAVGLVAILRSGAAYVPLDPAYPRERIDYMLADSKASILLCDADLADSVTLPDGVQVMALTDVLIPDLAAHSGQVPSGPEQGLAYVIYTSGSTGQPKGVELPHDALANLLQWQIQNSHAGKGWNTLQFAAFSFDVAFQELFATWATGGTLVLIEESQRRDPVRLIEQLDRHQVNRLFLPFVALQSLAEAAQMLDRYPQFLREVVTAGEQLVVTPAIRDFFRATAASLENQYGPSETHVVTAERLPADSGSWPELPPIGTAITGAAVKILDEREQELPRGVPGEICVAGRALARGYRGRPELTAARFFTAADGTRWYRTGDFGRRAHDGRLHYLGRRDGQVKVRGYRVELGEIEAHLKAQPGVADAVVVVRSDDRGKRFVAFCIPSTDEAPSPRELRSALAAALPEYMVPSAYGSVTEFPLTPSGKVDRIALAGKPIAAAPGIASQVARNEVERELVTLWQDLLGRDTVGVCDDFFDLGGDSFLGIQLAAAIKKTFDADLSLADILTARTISGLAETIQSGAYATSDGPLTLLQAGDGSGPLYAFHSLSGSVVRYAAFGSALGTDQTVWGIQSPGLQPGEVPLQSIADMADHYLKAMRAVHPGGPWHLVGYSMGGVFAVEVARRLRSAEEEVGLVGLIDTTAYSDLQEDTEFAIRRLARLTLRLDADIDTLLRLAPAEQSNRLYELGVAAGTLPADYDRDRISRMLNMYSINAAKLARHEISPYDSRLVLFRAADQSLDSGPGDSLLGWGPLAAEVQAHDIPGDHHTMMDPGNVEHLGRTVRAYLRPGLVR